MDNDREDYDEIVFRSEKWKHIEICYVVNLDKFYVAPIDSDDADSSTTVLLENSGSQKADSAEDENSEESRDIVEGDEIIWLDSFSFEDDMLLFNGDIITRIDFELLTQAVKSIKVEG